jgi:hypothetical protein
VPVQDNGFQVFINRAFVVTDTLAVTRARGAVGATMALSAETFSGAASASAASTSLPLAAVTVPEPATLLTSTIAGLAMWLLSLRRRSG